MSRILAEDEGMPDPSTFWRWHYADKELCEKVARAREHGAHAVVDETIEIADDGTNDWVERRRQDGSTYEEFNHEHVQRSKLRIETRQKYAQMIAPRTYGAKVDVTSGGEKIGDLDPVARATRLAAIFAEIEKQRSGDAD